jgi:transposase
VPLTPEPPPSQASLLQAQVDSLQQVLAETRQALVAAQRENTLLRQKVNALVRRCFGQKSEQLSSAQLELLLSGLTESRGELIPPSPVPALPAAPRRPPARSRRLRTPDNLEVVRTIITPACVLAEPDQWQCISQEASRQLDYQPGKFFWQETIRTKHVRRDQRALPPVLAPAPLRVAEHSLAAPGLLAYVLIGKYCDHLPFYRQEQIFWERHEVFIARQQMGQWQEQSVRLLTGITDCLEAQLRASLYVQVDETPVRYQDRTLAGRCGQGYLWTGLVPGECVIYQWHTSRSAQCLDALLGETYTGKIQCDGYSAYGAFAKAKTDLALFGCWAHARRHFYEAREQAPRVAGWLLNQIGLLYHWEEQWRQSRAGPALRQVYRASHSRMIVARLRRALERLQPRYLPRKRTYRCLLARERGRDRLAGWPG